VAQLLEAEQPVDVGDRRARAEQALVGELGVLDHHRVLRQAGERLHRLGRGREDRAVEPEHGDVGAFGARGGAPEVDEIVLVGRDEHAAVEAAGVRAARARGDELRLGGEAADDRLADVGALEAGHQAWP